MALGRKTGGRTKGTPNHATQAKAAEVAASGLTPLDYMLRVLRNEPHPDADVKVVIAHEMMRLDAAKAAAPYVHPRLANVELTGKDGGPLQVTVKNYVVAPLQMGSEAVSVKSVDGVAKRLPPHGTGLAPTQR
jgi:hypothetical protein